MVNLRPPCRWQTYLRSFVGSSVPPSWRLSGQLFFGLGVTGLAWITAANPGFARESVQAVAKQGQAGQDTGQVHFDLNDPEDALRARRRIFCSAVDGEPAIFWWQGDVYSRVPGERDRHLFTVQGVNVRACGTQTNELDSYGYRMVSREVMVYLDPDTQEVLDTWQNPWTDQVVEVLHVANDPVNGRPQFARTAAGDYTFNGLFQNGQILLRAMVPLFYPNPLAGDFQEYVGGTYHAMEMFDYTLAEADLLDATQDRVETVMVGWNRLSSWLPWMRMGDRPGTLIFDAAGMRAGTWADVPDPLRTAVETDYPLFQSPPPLDDNRPNETSWTNFRDYLLQQP